MYILLTGLNTVHVAVVVQFCFWFNLDFSLFFSMLIYDNEYQQRKIQIEPKTKLNYNIAILQ